MQIYLQESIGLDQNAENRQKICVVKNLGDDWNVCDISTTRKCLCQGKIWRPYSFSRNCSLVYQASKYSALTTIYDRTICLFQYGRPACSVLTPEMAPIGLIGQYTPSVVKSCHRCRSRKVKVCRENTSITSSTNISVWYENPAMLCLWKARRTMQHHRLCGLSVCSCRESPFKGTGPWAEAWYLTRSTRVALATATQCIKCSLVRGYKQRGRRSRGVSYRLIRSFFTN